MNRQSISLLFRLAGMGAAAVLLARPASANFFEWIGTGPEVSRVYAVAVDPGNSNVVLASLVGGDVFRSSDGGATWRPAQFAGTSETARSIVFDPSTPTNVYVSRYPGVWKSTDAGATWSNVSGSSFVGAAGALAIDPRVTLTLYSTGGPTGIERTTNGGVTWSAVGTGAPAFDPLSLSVDPLSSTAYAAFYGTGLFASTDGGATWQPRNNGLTAADIEVVAAVGGAGPTVYAGTASSGLWRSTNGGGHWSKIASFPRNYIGSIVAAGADASTVYAGTDIGAFKSTDGGSSWQERNSGLEKYYVFGLAVDPNHLATVFAGKGEDGVFKSTDGAGTWKSVNSGLSGPVVQALVGSPANRATVYAGTGDSGLFRSTDAGATWTRLDTGSDYGILSLATGPRSSDVLYAGTYFGELLRFTNGGSRVSLSNQLNVDSVSGVAVDSADSRRLYVASNPPISVSTDGGSSWSSDATGLPSSGFAIFVCADPNRGLAAITILNGVGLYRSTDGGESWHAVGAAVLDNDIRVVAFDPSTSGLVLASGSGGTYRSTDGGESWAKTSPIFFASLVADSLQAGRYLGGGTGGAVDVSTDGGQSWNRATDSGLPPSDVLSIAVLPIGAGTYVAGTYGRGIFVDARSARVGITSVRPVGPPDGAAGVTGR